ncbi:hypothetical protein HDZ31DRAFT_70699 [Schizophyllum fasciatum]
MYIFAPIAWPTAKLLDWALGKDEGHTYKKAELKSFLQFHRTGEEPLRDDEINILNGVLELNNKKVETIMTPMPDVVTLGADTVLDHDMIEKIVLSGYSRFPVHEPGKPDSFIGLLLIKKLLQYDPSQGLPVSSFPLSILPEAKPTINCFQALDYFQTGRAHLLLISNTPGKAGGALGVVTLEDIIEEIISEEIVDETDRYEDNLHKKRARRQGTAAIMRGIVERHMLRKNSLARIVEGRAGEGSPLLGATPEGSPSMRSEPSLRHALEPGSLHGGSSLRPAAARQALLRQDSSVSSSSGTATPAGNGEAGGRYVYGSISESPRGQ